MSEPPVGIEPTTYALREHFVALVRDSLRPITCVDGSRRLGSPAVFNGPGADFLRTAGARVPRGLGPDDQEIDRRRVLRRQPRGCSGCRKADGATEGWRAFEQVKKDVQGIRTID